MIRNDREYRVTKSRLADFEKARANATTPSVTPQHPKIVKAQRDALDSQIRELSTELSDYEGLVAGRRRVLTLASLAELPTALVEGRISAGLTQRQLAERLGIAEQQVQRYEATDYATASLARLVDVANAIGLNIREEVFLPSVELSDDVFLSRLETAGVEKRFARRVLLDNSNKPSSVELLVAAAATERVFGWSPADVFGSSQPLQSQAAVHAAQFKMYGGAKEDRTTFLATFGSYVARIAIKATPLLVAEQLPTNANGFRELVRSRQGTLNLTTVLETLWRAGVVVVPLSERGGYHGACWRHDGRSAIILKQRTTSEARWLHDLLHETHHAASMSDDAGWLDDEAMPLERMKLPEERRATRFAADVLLDGKAEQLARECVALAQKRVERLKAVVPRIADEHQVPIAALANYVAWRLQLDGVNWWGTAANLQGPPSDPARTARDFLLPRLDWTQLDRTDRYLLGKALEEVV